MSLILAFDLDDTLYDERTYVESGLRAVADYGAARFGWDADRSFARMVEILDAEGRGTVFDRWLAGHGQSGKGLVAEAVRAYRHHRPHLSLSPDAAALLPRLRDHPLYLVTDGHKLVQQRKVEALGIAPLFHKVFITHRYGVHNAKPSLHCFERIRGLEKADWRDIVYVGDNPAKDFVSLNAVGARTVRLVGGVHGGVEARAGHEAQHRIHSLAELPEVLGLTLAD
jgi:putative hydrolase of the HAD superfamily